MQNIHMLNIDNVEPRKIAQQLIDFHKANGLDDDQAKKAALTTFHVMLSAGLYPIANQQVQKARNFLMKNI